MPARDQLSVAFAALADPTRRDILERLRRGPQTAGDLAARYPISRPAVSQHLAVLEKAGLVARDRRAQWNDCSLTGQSLDAVSAWIEQQRADWNEQFDLLEAHLEARRANTGKPATDQPATDEGAQP
jgi:DNA-binding transcriptional ArsR family regulator